MSFAAVNHESVQKKYKKTKKVKNPVSNEYTGSTFPTQFTLDRGTGGAVFPS